MVDTPISLQNLAHEVVEWMDGQRHSQFPFCDTYLMWQHFEEVDITTYNCTLPYWRTHHNTIMEDISITGQLSEQIAEIVIVKGTKKGICLPNISPCRETYYIIKGNPPNILGKNWAKLVNTLEVHEYNLFSWKSRQLSYEKTIEGKGFSSGNVWFQNLHLQEGDIVAYVRYHNK